MPPKLKLVYFNIRGRGELVRLTLHAGGVDFIDERIPYEEWTQRKNQAPNGQVPYIVVDGKMYGEVLPIVRFISKKCGLLGKKEDDQIYVEILLEQVNKFRDQLIRPKVDSFLNKGQKEFLLKKLQEEEIPKFLTRVEEALKVSRTGFVLGGELTVADLSVWDTIDLLVSEKPDILGLYPKLLEHRAKIKTLPKLKKYLETRPPDQEVPKNPKATTMPQGSPQKAQYQGVGSSTK
ncbi:hypothetical protein RRG08_021491 [Elysia crispata]|uniref:Glutathione S-transferase n=1 Tax=Elysia crispata TaxID=231223 RepID=A0AAE1EEY7_9GAST|nr:hypothetical protein RRG08_021491 [Elysia crispata]